MLGKKKKECNVEKKDIFLGSIDLIVILIIKCTCRYCSKIMKIKQSKQTKAYPKNKVEINSIVAKILF